MGREFDAVIIGAGAAGYSAGVHIARLGGKVALVERENVGGLCVHFGCIPTKVLVAMGRTMLEIKQAQRRGVISKLVSYSPSEADAWRERVVRRFAKAVEANL
ncbi:MAG: dihydrolipoyl dehydrogenase, partial [Candidatus Omnitrophota bacterium]